MSKGEGARDKAPKVERDFEIPQPEVRARPATPDEIPQGARIVANKAKRHGWDVTITYARGPYVNADGSLNRIAGSIKVLAVRGGRRVMSLWAEKANGKYDREFGYTTEGATSCGSEEIKKALEAPESEEQ